MKKDVTMRKNTFVKGAFITTIGIVLTKILGILYVIPFHAIIGEEGGALYGYAYTIYLFFVSFSSAGVPLAISKIDEGNLKTVASGLGIDYIHMTNTSSIEHKLNEISSKAVKSDPTEEETYRDIYYIFAIMLLAVLGYEFIYIRRRVL